MNNIILCGFMGCGKTTVGTLLARRLGMEYADLDAEIEAEAGMAIPAIFAEYGEARFRDLEHEAVRALAGRADCVVSTGGGALTYPRNREALSPRDLVVFLDAPFDACLERIRGSDRPIVRRSSPEELRALFDARRPAYLAAANAVADASAGPEAVAEAVARRALLSLRIGSPVQASMRSAMNCSNSERIFSKGFAGSSRLRP